MGAGAVAGGGVGVKVTGAIGVDVGIGRTVPVGRGAGLLPVEKIAQLAVPQHSTMAATMQITATLTGVANSLKLVIFASIAEVS